MSERNIYISEVEARSWARLIGEYINIYYPNFRKGMSLCDLGCGKGELLNALGLEFPQAFLYGVDLDSKVLDQAIAKVPKATLKTAILIKTPFSDGSFQLITSTLIYHYSTHSGFMGKTYSMSQLAKETSRLLSAGGVFIPTESFNFEDSEVSGVFQAQGLKVKNLVGSIAFEK